MRILLLLICIGFSAQALAKAPYMVAAANPLAAKAGYDVLKKGGTAIDAAIAVSMVLNLVEPQSAGIGGGGFVVHYDAANQKIQTYDGRETAPEYIKPDVFLDKNGQPLPFFDAVKGGRSVAVPGLLAMLDMAHKMHGKMGWEELFAPAIHLARQGFELSPRLHDSLSSVPYLKDFDQTANLYLDGGKAKPVGTVLKNEALAETFELIAEEGISAFYKGSIAQHIVDAVNHAGVNPAQMTMEDLAKYKAKERDPVCAKYRSYKVCGMGPPSSGGITLLQMLGILENFDLAEMKPESIEAIHLIAEASRLAFADRNKYIADSDFEEVPVDSMLDKDYLRKRAALINPDKAMTHISAGEFAVKVANILEDTEAPSTTHVSIVDKWGNAVSFTSSIEYKFGSAISVEGFLLNNELTDFSFRPELNGVKVANRVASGKRPRSSMTPTLVFDENDKLLLVIGSPGGSRIIGYVLQGVIEILDWGYSPDQAVKSLHYLSRGKLLEIENGSITKSLEAMGHDVKVHSLTSGLHIISVAEDGSLRGGADPRREGIVLGN